jgi:hypothetical protein
MNIVDRVKNILLSPKEEWPKIEPEAATTQSLYLGYILILAAIGPICTALRAFPFGIVAAVLAYVIALAMTYVVALIVDALAPSFGGEKNFIQSLKLTAYSHTAVWVAGILQLLGTIGGLIGLLAAIYAFYTFYLGAPVMKKCSAEKAVGYTLVVVICAIVLSVLVGGVLVSLVLGGGMMGASALGSFH